MEATELTKNNRQEQLRRWNSLTPGAIFESVFSTLYLVTAKDDQEITVIPLGDQVRASIAAGKPVTATEQIRFGDLTIRSVFPVSPCSNQSPVDSSLRPEITTLDTCFQMLVPDRHFAWEGK